MNIFNSKKKKYSKEIEKIKNMAYLGSYIMSLWKKKLELKWKRYRQHSCIWFTASYYNNDGIEINLLKHINWKNNWQNKIIQS